MPKVLIIEDRRENIVFIANNILRPMGYDVITARDGVLGLSKAEEESPDVIITDLHLPKMTGLQVLEALQDKNIYIPSIVMTFHGNEQTAVKALRLGARDYLIKPFTPEDMEIALKRALKTRANSGGSPVVLQAAQNRITQLEQELIKIRQILAQREAQLKQLERKPVVDPDQAEIIKAVQQAAEWEQDNIRMNKMLAQAKFALSKSHKRTHALEEAMKAQQMQGGKYQRETMRLAGEMRKLSEAMRLMSLDMVKHLNRLSTLYPKNESERGE